jgi:hypothetical protein
MANEKYEPSKPDASNKDASIKSDPGTTDTTDPQEHMKGPLSSLMHSIEKKAEANDKKDQEEEKEDKE